MQPAAGVSVQEGLDGPGPLGGVEFDDPTDVEQLFVLGCRFLVEINGVAAHDLAVAEGVRDDKVLVGPGRQGRIDGLEFADVGQRDLPHETGGPLEVGRCLGVSVGREGRTGNVERISGKVVDHRPGVGRSPAGLEADKILVAFRDAVPLDNAASGRARGDGQGGFHGSRRRVFGGRCVGDLHGIGCGCLSPVVPGVDRFRDRFERGVLYAFLHAFAIGRR
mmetsp:Transcript_11551/g.24488  ORF Transcript_11551/g.24488 Transcript_11551/m.24488 type:complete len:221 (-) Transcript_11551:130-792(-)